MLLCDLKDSSNCLCLYSESQRKKMKKWLFLKFPNIVKNNNDNYFLLQNFIESQVEQMNRKLYLEIL